MDIARGALMDILVKYFELRRTCRNYWYNKFFVRVFQSLKFYSQTSLSEYKGKHTLKKWCLVVGVMLINYNL